MFGFDGRDGLKVGNELEMVEAESCVEAWRVEEFMSSVSALEMEGGRWVGTGESVRVRVE